MLTLKEVSCGQALTELWDAIAGLMPFPCDPELNDAFAINVRPRPSNCRPGSEFIRQSIVIRFGKRGLSMYQCASDGTRQRTRDDVAYVVTMMLRAYNLGLHSSRARDAPFVIDCELVLFPE
jgi:hypothetical protein